jgi:hypothetical protein
MAQHRANPLSLPFSSLIGSSFLFHLSLPPMAQHRANPLSLSSDWSAQYLLSSDWSAQ